jgi:hypothetical protein
MLAEMMRAPDGEPVFQNACRVGRPYRSGRSPDWLKIKNPHAPAASREFER